MRSHKYSQGEGYTQLVSGIVEEADADDKYLMRCSDQHKDMTSNETQESCGFKINHWCVYASYEDTQKENEEVEKKHSDTMLMDYDEELILLEEWLVNPRIDEDCIIVADTENQIMLSCKIISEGDEDQDWRFFCEDGFMLQQEVVDQKIIFNDNKETEYVEKDGEMEIRAIHIIPTEEKQHICNNAMCQQRTELDIEIDELWKLIKKRSRWKYHEMKRTINHEL